ncbi:MAG: DUF4129 domain-containing protein [Pseudonocardiaceae bacterium]
MPALPGLGPFREPVIAVDRPAAEVPVDVGRDEAREAAARELADPAYQSAEPSLFTRLATWLIDGLERLIEALGTVSPGGGFGLIVLAGLIVVIVVIIRLRMGTVARTASIERPVSADRPKSAAEHREAAATAFSRGELAEAIRERFRAVVRELEQRGVLGVQTGRTVEETAAEAGVLLPGCADALREGARIFDDVVYGAREATDAHYQALAELDHRVQTERPTFAGSSP